MLQLKMEKTDDDVKARYSALKKAFDDYSKSRSRFLTPFLMVAMAAFSSVVRSAGLSRFSVSRAGPAVNAKARRIFDAAGRRYGKPGGMARDFAPTHVRARRREER
jgi:hypothetical protein